ncbi:copper chaperone PCu(A)C [Devosia sp. BK]|uniref:copper chaperone PCu(A)C n=1 Tax=Devosia sp. BK TaxID=2871706 RepID=UPI00293B2B64|nr:copper chaperone PCu(A)C [Devosia sp. BK]MDV3253163.1 copper chaperone PCu(A)C [Devosia sp. BK]
MTRRLTTFALAAMLLASPATLAYAQDAHSHTAAPAGDVVTVGTLEISGAFTRATLPNAPVGGGFFTIHNTGSEDDRLVSASTPIAKATQIHEMAMEGDVMKMRELDEGLVIPAGETVVLEPGGKHLMMMGLTGAITEGETVPVTLTFEKAGDVTLDLTAAGTAADAPAAGHH